MFNLNKFLAVLFSLALTIYFFGSYSFIKLHYLLVLAVGVRYAIIANNNYRIGVCYNPLYLLFLGFTILLLLGNLYSSGPQYGLFKTFIFISVLLPFVIIKNFDFPP